MDPRRVLLALVRLWADLPRLCGAAWGEAYPRLLDVLSHLKRSDEPEGLTGQTLELVRLLVEDREPARARIAQEVEKLGREERDAGEAVSWQDVTAGLRSRMEPPEVVRFADVSAPERIVRGVRSHVVARLTASPREESLEALPLSVSAGRTIQVVLLSTGEEGALEIEGSAVREIEIAPEEDSEPVVFYFRSHVVGRHLSRLEFLQDGISVGVVGWTLETIEEGVEDSSPFQSTSSRRAAKVHLGGSYAPPVDFHLSVHVDPETQKRLTYVVSSPSGAVDLHEQVISGPTLKSPVHRYQQQLIEDLENLPEGRDRTSSSLSPRQRWQRLEAAGRGLYQELFPAELRGLYHQSHDKVETFLITSDEPYIPWELAKPYDPDAPGGRIDHDHLCAQFAMSRWLRGQSKLVSRIDVQRLACIVVDRLPKREKCPELPGARRDGQLLRQLVDGARGALEDRSPDPVTLDAIGDLLDQGGIDLWHFAGHGDRMLRGDVDPNLPLPDDNAFTPADLEGSGSERIREDRPLVFWNACRMAQMHWGLTGLEGWAKAWVSSRCGGFLSPLWSVRDQAAHTFAVTFYGELRKHRTLGQAVREARKVVRQKHPEDFTWLAYSLYAHANAHVRFAQFAHGVD